MLKTNSFRYWSKEYLLKNPLGRSVLYSGVILLFLLMMFFLMLLPKTRAVFSKWKKINQMKEENVHLERDVGLLASWKWKEVEKMTKLVEFAFPTQKDIYLIIFAVQDPVRRHGFVIDKMNFDMGEVVGKTLDQSKKRLLAKPGSKHRKDGFGEPNSIVVSLSVLGRQEKLSDLIDDFNHSLPLISVNEISFSLQGKNSGLVSAQMKLKIYFYPPFEKKMDLKRIPLRDLQLTKAELETVSSLYDYYDRGSNFYQRLKSYQESSFYSTSLETGRKNPFLLP